MTAETETKTDANTGTLQMMTEAQVREPKSSVGVYTLPCGYLDATGVLHTEVVVTEINGSDEDMLGSNKTPAQKKLNQLLISRVQRIGSITDRNSIAAAVPELLVGDRVFLILAIRRVSLGDDYPYKDICPSCEKESLMTIDLSTLDIIAMPDPRKRVYDAKLPSKAACREWANSGTVPPAEKLNPTGHTIRFRVMVGRDEEQVGKVQGKDDAISKLLAMRVELLDGKPPTIADFQVMSMAERSYIRDELFRQNDGGVETTLEVTCPKCDHDYERELEIGQTGFFFPSQARRNSKAKSST
jgi:hypothetical protein